MFSSRTKRSIHSVAIVILIFTGYTTPCGPDFKPGKGKSRRKATPFVYKQHFPNISEFAYGASEPPNGAISRGGPGFEDLVENHSPDIIFRDEERDGSDRIMTQRCKEKLNILAVLVQNQWPGNPPLVPPVKVKVKEAWDDNYMHGENSLHYEGRAVDVATSDRDRSKLGMLASLAVEAGFDWVEYESHGHIHCSVKSDSSAAIRTGGCFTGTSTVQLENGHHVTMSDLRIGDRVLSMRSDGVLEYSEVINFMDRDDAGYGLFYTFSTESGKEITLTAKHLLYVIKQNSSFSVDRIETVFADRVTEGQYLLLRDKDSIIATIITKVTVKTRRGIYAPLTKHGTIVVDDIVASCYAYIENINIAHTVFAPMRVMYDISNYFTSFWSQPYNAVEFRNSTNLPTGMHWYSKALYNIGSKILSRDTLYVH